MDKTIKEIEESLIGSHYWFGTLKVNGGWGPKNALMEYISTNSEGIYFDVFCKFPKVKEKKVNESREDILSLLKDLETNQFAPIEEGYHVGFHGSLWKEFKELSLEFFKHTETTSKFEYELEPWLPSGPTDTSNPPTKLCILGQNNLLSYRIVEGKWKSNYDEPVPVVAW